MQLLGSLLSFWVFHLFMSQQPLWCGSLKLHHSSNTSCKSALFPHLPSRAFFALASWTFFFPPITTLFKSSLESIYHSLKVIARYEEKSIPKEQCRMVTPLQISRGRQSRVFLKGQAKGTCVRTAVGIPLTPSVPLTLGPPRWAATTAPSWQHGSQQELLRLLFQSLSQQQWTWAAHTGWISFFTS